METKSNMSIFIKKIAEFYFTPRDGIIVNDPLLVSTDVSTILMFGKTFVNLYKMSTAVSGSLATVCANH